MIATAIGEERPQTMRRSRTSLSGLVLLAMLAVLVSSCRLSGTDESESLAPTVAALLTQVSVQATELKSQGTFISHLATRIPRSTAPPPGQPTPTPPVMGAVVIEEGRCCVGGLAGQALLIRVAFQAFSPLAPVTEMRVRAGGRWFEQDEFSETDWEPFTSSKTYDFTPPINWVGFYISAQFRDAQGWLSPVYHDDISVEGMPPSPSPAPMP